MLLKVGDPVILEYNNQPQYSIARIISRISKDGRWQIGQEWFVPNVPDKWGRVARKMTDTEYSAYKLEEYKRSLVIRLEDLTSDPQVLSEIDRIITAAETPLKQQKPAIKLQKLHKVRITTETVYRKSFDLELNDSDYELLTEGDSSPIGERNLWQEAEEDGPDETDYTMFDYDLYKQVVDWK